VATRTASTRGAERLPLVPLREMVLFPGMVVPLIVGRTRSLIAVEEALAAGTPLFLVMQKSAVVEEPGRDDLHDVGVMAEVLQTLRGPDGSMKVVVEVVERGRLRRHVAGPEFDEALVAQMLETPSKHPEDEQLAVAKTLVEQFETYARMSQRVAPEIPLSLQTMDDPAAICDVIVAHLAIKAGERQTVLECEALSERIDRVSQILLREIDLFELEQRTSERFRAQTDQGQRERYLHEQLRTIQEELGSREGGDEILEMRQRIEDSKMPDEVRERALRELTRYERTPPLSPEGAITQAYVEWLSDVPWNTRSRDKLDLDRAQTILDEDHYGLERVKERILEFLAVRKLSRTSRGPVLCLVGPPGVGKTSLGRSIARAMGRKFVRVSLGGIRDEAEIRGHRRTYVGALPGRIVQGMKRAGVVNPVFMLDEIDKLSADFRGDPASALLEVLDPEQNKAFSDHYLEVDYDLHEVFFVTTANSDYDIPEPLLDRMEVVRIPGYTLLEKARIAELFLIPKQMKESGLSDKTIHFERSGLDTLIDRYTREAGVRELDRQIAKVCRKIAYQVVRTNGAKGTKAQRATVDDDRVFKLLGPPPYSEIDPVNKAETGVGIGLAWTQDGGDTLVIETTLSRGKGELKMTGQLGEVMQESAHTAYTYLRANARKLDFTGEFWKTSDIHLHVPEGAIPKDGPSAGTAIAVSILSALRKRSPKSNIAMTGEVTLRGRVLGVGGVKEKVLAAHRAKITTVFLPKSNEKDLEEIPAEIKGDVTFVLVETLDELIRQVFPARRAPRKKKAR